MWDGLIQMKPIERVRAVQQITAAMLESLDWDDISIFFTRLGLDEPESFNNKDELVRRYLARCSDAVLVEIGEQLGLAEAPVEDERFPVRQSKYWLSDHFRVFISHVHTARKSAGTLKSAMQAYGITAFVAHDDIETSDEWREEILSALMSMHAFVAVLTEDFSTSAWTDQEVGIAVARDVLVIPLSKGAIPYGFIGKYQSFNGAGRTVAEVAESVFRAICSSPRTRPEMIKCLVNTISRASDADTAIFRIQKLDRIDGVQVEDWARVRQDVSAHAVLGRSAPLLHALNGALVRHGLEPLSAGQLARPVPAFDDEIPF